MLNFRRSSLNKSPLGSAINWGHPLASNLVGAWLFNEGGYGPVIGSDAVVQSLVNANDGLVYRNGHGGSKVPQWGAGPAQGGISMLDYRQQGGDSSSIPYSAIASPSAGLQPTDMVTMFWGGIIFQNQQGANHPCLFGIRTGDTYGIRRYSSDNTAILPTYNLTTSGETTPIITNVITYGIWQGYSLSVKNGSQLVYAQGRQVFSDTKAGTLTYSSPQFAVNTNTTGVGGGSVEIANCGTQVVYVWHRLLSAAEHQWVYQEPFSLIEWKSPRSRFFFGTPVPPPPAFVAWTDPQIPQLLAQ